ncbi:hypothetical protein F5Y12DRAFT_712696 [Xylaria sp. FL1777]|nr:hypothetical protein F5Y12DRAFT_712696 [Xylaria sp. FL1777]
MRKEVDESSLKSHRAPPPSITGPTRDEAAPPRSGGQLNALATGQTIGDVLRRHGGIPLDTPVFELRDVLSEKYGEDSRLLSRALRKKSSSELAHEADVYIMALGGKDFDGLLLERLKVARELWDVGIRTEFTAKVKPRLQQQFSASDDSLIAVILGQEELESGQVRLKVVSANTKDALQTTRDKDTVQKDRGELILRGKLVEEVQKRLSALVGRSKW